MPRLQAAGPGSQSDGSQPLQIGSKGAVGQLRGQTAMDLSHGGVRGAPLAAPTPMVQLPKTTAGPGDNSPGGKASESVPANVNPANLTKQHLSSSSTEKANTDGAVAPNQAFHPQAAHAVAGVDVTTQQTDTRTLKDAGKKIETAEVKAEKGTGPTSNPVWPKGCM